MLSFSAGKLIFVPTGEPEWTESVSLADVVILIGGLGGTYATGALAKKLGIPVLPLADTGGDAKRFYIESYRAWDSQPVASLPLETFQRLARIAPEVVQDVLDILEQVT